MKYYILKIIRIIAYVIVGIVLILGSYFFLDNLVNYLNLIVGLSLFYGSLTSFLLSIKRRSFEHEDNHVASHALTIIFSVVILISKYLFSDVEFSLICSLWGVTAIINGSLRLNKSIYEINKKEISGSNIIETIESVIEIVLAIILILNPEAHVKTHIILLGLSNILFAIILFVHEFKYRMQINKVLNK